MNVADYRLVQEKLFGFHHIIMGVTTFMSQSQYHTSENG